MQGGEILQDAIPDALVFKAFNTVGAAQLGAPDGSLITGEQLTMLYAGSQKAQKQAEEIIAEGGFKPYYVGPIRYARNLEVSADKIVAVERFLTEVDTLTLIGRYCAPSCPNSVHSISNALLTLDVVQVTFCDDALTTLWQRLFIRLDQILWTSQNLLAVSTYTEQIWR